MCTCSSDVTVSACLTRAKSHCDLFVLSKEALDFVLKSYPDIREQIKIRVQDKRADRAKKFLKSQVTRTAQDDDRRRSIVSYLGKREESLKMTAAQAAAAAAADSSNKSSPDIKTKMTSSGPARIESRASSTWSQQRTSILSVRRDSHMAVTSFTLLYTKIISVSSKICSKLDIQLIFKQSALLVVRLSTASIVYWRQIVGGLFISLALCCGDGAVDGVFVP